MLTAKQAYTVASQWGSFMRAGDPGAIFYSFPSDDAAPGSEAHRRALLTYTDSLIQDSEARLNRELIEDGVEPAARPDMQAELSELKSLRAFFQRCPILADLDEFTRAYLTAAIWASSDDADDSGGTPLDQTYTPADIHPDSFVRMVRDCRDFQTRNMRTLVAAYAVPGYNAEKAGHDFWLTRNGHGAGFWDRDLGKPGERLTGAAHSFGEMDLYVGDDGKIHI